MVDPGFKPGSQTAKICQTVNKLATRDDHRSREGALYLLFRKKKRQKKIERSKQDKKRKRNEKLTGEGTMKKMEY